MWPFGRPPFEVQSEALRRGGDRPGYGYWMEQGLGKSAVLLADYLRHRDAGEIDTLVVLCPNSLKGNWLDQVDEWKADTLPVAWDTPAWDKAAKKADTFIFNYEAALASGGDMIKWILENRNCMLALDESHRVKNPTSDTTKKVLGQFSKNVKFRRTLTGTPMTRTPLDFFTQLRLSGALDGWNPVAFRNRFCTMGGFKGKQVLPIPRNPEELQKLIAEYAFRATKVEWAKDLPPKLYKEPISLALPPALLRHYKSMHEEFVVFVGSIQDPANIVTANMAAGQYLKLQQISSGFILDGDQAHDLLPMGQLPKWQATRDVIDANGTKSKTLVFGHFRHTIDRLVEAVEKDFGYRPAVIRGGMKDAETRAEKAAFNDASGPQVMVLQLAAGKEGHTLLGAQGVNPCHTVVYFENNFNLVDRAQSEDRPHRYGQTNPVLYNDFYSSPIERHIIRAYQAKKSIIDYLLDNKQRLDA